MKFVIFDSGPIISLTMNGLLDILEKLKKDFSGEFIITPQVKEEIIDRPMNIKKYEFEAIRVNDLLERGILKLSSQFVPNNLLEKEINKILEIANSSFYGPEKINLIQRADASCLALSKLCKEDNIIVVDERAMTMLVESPENLKEIMEKKLHTKIRINQSNVSKLGKYKIIRSAEILYIAYKKGLFEYKKDKRLLDSLLYAVKFKGASISYNEIERIKQIAS